MERAPIYDNHVHLRPDGRGVEALREFQQAGGTGITLVNLPYPHLPVRSKEDIVESYRVTLRMAQQARLLPDLEVNVALGPYPVLLMGLEELHGLQRAEGIMMQAVDEAAGLVEAGEAQALGEVGRPHFPVPEPIWLSSNRILSHAMRRASELGCPVVIHSESATPESMAEFAAMADAAGLERHRVVKHFCGPLNRPELSHGILGSLPASRKTVREALENGGPFLLETDYVDDPEKPGAVMSINSVPKRVKAMLASGEMGLETAWAIGQDTPRRLYRR
jgi:TatD-related deoxyribonuclease